MKKVYLGLGSNIGDRAGTLQAAIDELRSGGVNVARVSPVYETEPMDMPNQAWFLNLVVEGETDLFPMQLLARIGKIEWKLGRRRGIPKGPRTIDIDILLFGAAVIRSAALTVPHPRLAQRRFVLQPLADLAPELREPVSRKTIRDLLAGVSAQSLRKTDIMLV